MNVKHIANQLSAISTILEDESADLYGDLSPSAVAALIAMKRAPGISIGTVAKEVRLSHSATVRLIDRLEKDWLVRRLRRRGREVMVELTVRGQRRAEEVSEARNKSASQLLEGLDDTGLEQMSALFSRVLQLSQTPTCTRFCETDPLNPVVEQELETA
ncbi:MarR family winged helix-turn-helix transcriptional regulator [Polycladidibacter stylochi]|uniref:MarR family winged helix-turn-helix transcriptional regulator n=1 Tax=Polycladidibacter stylochi TaxID=1807766 RepID=UPI00082DE756|nr:MarR family transcriptional regulator [Pseudovibrio stylochi]